ncbi:MAG TPA: Hpt domain-containing protein, partial [Vicinamibacterales bacterium]
MPADPYRYFRIESRELLNQLGQGVLELEKGGSAAEVIPRLLRLAHTLKGAARVVRQPQIAEDAHALEDLFAALREAAAPPTGEQVNRMLALLDRMATSVAALDRPDAAQEGAA